MNYCPLVCASVLYQMRICGQAVGNNHLSQRSYNSLKVVHDSTLWRNGYLSSFQPYLGFCLFARILSQFPQGMFQTVDLSESLASCWQSRHASVEKGSRNDCLWSQSQRERERERDLQGLSIQALLMDKAKGSSGQENFAPALLPPHWALSSAFLPSSPCFQELLQRSIVEWIALTRDVRKQRKAACI